MRRLLTAVTKRLNVLFVLFGCAVMAAPPFLLADRHASPNRDMGTPYVVKAITAENGVPCVLVLAGTTGVAISCDWGSYDAPSDTAAFRSWHHSGKVPS